MRAAFDQPNVGTRARRIVYALASLGEAVAALASQVSSDHFSGGDFVGLERNDLDYSGWWTAEHVEPITRHIPLQLTEDAFLDRCDKLFQLVGEGLSESALRRLLEASGVQPDDIQGFSSLKLLYQVTRLGNLASRTGLRLGRGSPLHSRLKEETEFTHSEKLFALYNLRMLADHRYEKGGRKRLNEALEIFGLDPAAYASGWGPALDAIYDGVAESLEEAASTVTQAIR